MKREFDVHRDIWGPQVAFMLHVLADALQEPVINENPLEISFPDIEQVQNFITPNPVVQKHLSGESLIYRDITNGPDESLKYFDYASEEYDLASLPFKEKLWPALQVLLSQLLTPNCRVLDAACGTGFEAIQISKMLTNGEVVAVDLSYNMIQRAYRNANLEGITNMAFYHANNRHLPHDWTQAFDVVLCNLALHYFDDAAASLNELSKLLQPNGVFIITEPIKNQTSPGIASALKSANPHFNQFYSRQEIVEILLPHGLVNIKSVKPFKGIETLVFKRMLN